jgi:hypothetical protein
MGNQSIIVFRLTLYPHGPVNKLHEAKVKRHQEISGCCPASILGERMYQVTGI